MKWPTVPLGEIADVQLGKMLDKAKRREGNPLPYLRNVNVRWGTVDTNDLLEMPFRDAELERYSVRDGDVLVCEGGEPGRAAVWRGSGQVKFQKALHRVRFKRAFDPRLLVYYLESLAKAGRLERRFTGSTIKHFTREAIVQLPIPVPSLEEQQSLVAEIEKHLTRLDAAVAALRRVQSHLKRYRAAVLQTAFDGRLAASDPPVEESTGRATLRPWETATIDAVTDLVQYGTSAKTNNDPTGVPVIRMGNIQDGRLVLDDLKYLPTVHHEFPDLLLKPGDVLFNRTNSAELVGKTAVYRGVPERCSFASYLIRLRPTSRCHPDYLSAYINSPAGRRWVSRVVSQQVGQANVNGSKLRALEIPLAPLAEQHRIVAEVERRFSVVQQLEATIAASLQRGARLRQSILDRAFRGELVPDAVGS